MLQENDADLAAARRRGGPDPGRCDHLPPPRHHADAMAFRAVHRDHRDAVRRQLIERRRNLSRPGIVEPDDPGQRRCRCRSGEHLPHPGRHCRRNRTPRWSGGWPERATRLTTDRSVPMRRSLDIAHAENLGDEAARARTGADRRSRRGAATAGCERPAARGTATKAVGAHRREEELEIFGSGQRPLRDHRDPALHVGSMMKVRPVTRAVSWMKARYRPREGSARAAREAAPVARRSGPRRPKLVSKAQPHRIGTARLAAIDHSIHVALPARAIRARACSIEVTR